MIDYINWGMVALIAGLAGGWWLRGQTFGTISADIASIKQDIVNIKNYFEPAKVVVAPVTPAPVVVSAPVAV